MDDAEIYRVAGVLLDSLGDKALSMASERALALAKAGEPEAAFAFVRIAEAICELRRRQRRPGEAVN